MKKTFKTLAAIVAAGFMLTTGFFSCSSGDDSGDSGSTEQSSPEIKTDSNSTGKLEKTYWTYDETVTMDSTSMTIKNVKYIYLDGTKGTVYVSKDDLSGYEQDTDSSFTYTVSGTTVTISISYKDGNGNTRTEEVNAVLSPDKTTITVHVTAYDGTTENKVYKKANAAPSKPEISKDGSTTYDNTEMPSKTTIAIITVTNGIASDPKTIALSSLTSYIPNGAKLCSDAAGTNEITDYSTVKAGDSVYVIVTSGDLTTDANSKTITVITVTDGTASEPKKIALSELESSIPKGAKLCIDEAGEYEIVDIRQVQAGETVYIIVTSQSTTDDDFVEVESIILDKTRIANTGGNREVKATIKLNYSSKDCVLKAWLSGDFDTVYANIAKGEYVYDGYKATFMVPEIDSVDSNGMECTVNISVDGKKSEKSATLKIVPKTSITSIVLEEDHILVNDDVLYSITEKQSSNYSTSGLVIVSDTPTPIYKKITVNGSNFDVANSISLQFYDSDNNPYGDKNTIDLSYYDENSKSLETSALKMPLVAGTYTLKALVNNKTADATVKFTVYEVEFTSIHIPTIGIRYGTKEFKVVVKGNGFTAPGVLPSDFTIDTGSNYVDSESTPTILSDEELCYYLHLNGTSGKHFSTKITVERKNKADLKTKTNYVSKGDKTISGSLAVAPDFGTSGIVLLKKDETYGYAHKCAGYSPTEYDLKNAIGLIVGYDAYGVPYAVGLNRSKNKLQWAMNGVPYDYEPGNTLDGNDGITNRSGEANWNKICEKYPDYTSNSDNYPAFAWAQNYFENYNTGANKVDSCSWFLPNQRELDLLYGSIGTLYDKVEIFNEIADIRSTGKIGLINADPYEYNACWSSNVPLYPTNSYYVVVMTRVLRVTQYSGDF